jgi:SAM-dependent methyltransferase
MLDVARERSSGVRYTCLDVRAAAQNFGNNFFDCVFVFRFFANADDELRNIAADQVRKLLKPGGYLVFNNHRNYWSIPEMAKRTIGFGGGGATNAELQRLFVVRQFQRVGRYSLGVWPHGELSSFALPWRSVRRLEELNLNIMSRYHSVGYNTIWVMKKG